MFQMYGYGFVLFFKKEKKKKEKKKKESIKKKGYWFVCVNNQIKSLNFLLSYTP